MRKSLVVRAATWVVGVGALSFLASNMAHAQNNYLTFNNGSEAAFAFPGQATSGSNPNLYWRCYPQNVLWAPNNQKDGVNTGPGLGVTGWQSVLETHSPAQNWGSPIFFFVNDTGRTCVLSAAVGGGFPPTKQTITASANNFASFYFYTPVACTSPFAWWFAFTGSAFGAVGTTGSPPKPNNLIVGWSDQNNTTASAFSYLIGSTNETAAARSRSYINGNAAGLAIFQTNSTNEWGMEAMIEDPIDAPQRPGDLGGSGGYTPLAGPGAGTGVQFHAFNLQSAAPGGHFPVFLANILFGGGATSHHPGITLFGQHLRLNPDPLWLLLLSLPFAGPAYNAPIGPAPFWNPNAGWQPGGESTSATLPLTPGTLNLTLGCAFITADLASPPPLIPNSSNGSQFTVR